jgi:hypothetical protein
MPHSNPISHKWSFATAGRDDFAKRGESYSMRNRENTDKTDSRREMPLKKSCYDSVLDRELN